MTQQLEASSTPVLPLSFQKVAQLPVDSPLQVEGGHDVGVGLADHEVVDIEHLRQGTHGQVFFQAAVTPPPSSIIVLSFWLESASPAASITQCLTCCKINKQQIFHT